MRREIFKIADQYTKPTNPRLFFFLSQNHATPKAEPHRLYKCFALFRQSASFTAQAQNVYNAHHEYPGICPDALFFRLQDVHYERLNLSPFRG